MSTVLKTCTCCGLAKPWNPDPFIRNSKASGFQGGRCWACHLEAHREANQRHRSTPKGREAVNEASRRWRENPENREANREASRRWGANPENREAKNEAKRRWQQTPEGRAFKQEAAQRRKQAPKWDRDAIVRIQAQAEREGLGTDHIFAIKAIDPKTGIRASGLHRSWNLQILGAAENKSKGNRVDFEQEAQRLMDHVPSVL